VTLSWAGGAKIITPSTPLAEAPPDLTDTLQPTFNDHITSRTTAWEDAGGSGETVIIADVGTATHVAIEALSAGLTVHTFCWL
jgi:hypothetical protein